MYKRVFGCFLLTYSTCKVFRAWFLACFFAGKFFGGPSKNMRGKKRGCNVGCAGFCLKRIFPGGKNAEKRTEENRHKKVSIVNLPQALGQLNQTIFRLLHCFNAWYRGFCTQSGENANRNFFGKIFCWKKHKMVMYMMDFSFVNCVFGRNWFF